MTQEERYLIKERAESDIKKYGTVQSAISCLKTKLEQMESLWGKYSSECLGHAIICTQLKISWLERKTTPSAE